MNFAEAHFWGLLLGGLMVILGLRGSWMIWGRTPPAWFDKTALLGLGLFLLFWVSPTTLLIFLMVAVGSYGGLQWVLRHPQPVRWRYLFLLIPLQLLPLVFYKYSNFMVNQVFSGDVPGLRDLVIPVGISFYSFQKVAFVVDTLVFHQPLPQFLDYLNFAGFFPQIVAGPIERRKDLLPQMEQFRFYWSAKNLNEGTRWIALGLFFKMCLADNLAECMYGVSVTNAYLIWLDNVFFGLRIYYDFAGYSLIAVGLARCLGIRLTLNFLSPYCSTSMGEFWRRWHVTLSQWFRDYVYIPLGGGRTRWWAFNILLVFVVSGVWHGAGWNFVLWGAIHGAALIVNRLLGKYFSVPGWVGWLLTMTTSFCAWLAFYEHRTRVLGAKMLALFTSDAYGAAAWREAVAHWNSPNGFVMVFILTLVAGVLILEWQSIARRNQPFYLLQRTWVLIILVSLTVLLSPQTNNGFIYFAF
jgi:D-alanyl-lipoteichoic acid acyltransferase DltB (MBOAT superfamily)